MDPYEFLQVVPKADGTLTRHLTFPDSSPSPDPDILTPVLSKDIPINLQNGTWVRIYVPRDHVLGSSSSSDAKLPLLFYIHGGGFIYMSASSTLVHDFCFNMALQVPAVIVSVEYRLAPEHRLPAAYDDAMEALHWLRTKDDVWLRNYADYGRCFLMGTSAGGNIAYQVGLRAAAQADRIAPVKIQGMILHHPFFGGVKRTGSEIRLVDDANLPPVSCDVMWDFSLPLGADRDHEHCNPTVGGGSKLLDQVRLIGWRILISGCDGDPLIDRQIELAKMMEEKGIKVDARFTEGDYHGVEMLDLSKAKSLNLVLKDFMSPLSLS